MKRILFLTEGGRAYGLGHLSRCFALAQAFEESGILVRFVLSGDAGAASFFGAREVHLLDWTENYVKLNPFIEEADAVVVDSYRASPECYQRIAADTGLGIYLDDNGRIDYPEGAHCLPMLLLQFFAYHLSFEKYKSRQIELIS